ncbi:hypothetical protein [Nocardia sp. CA-290969]|uniref:hypothetical protein n=1 Tax=Nocardia sp. CA-290969 TaxID=3239986 RepID=UPI003D8EBD1E
MTDYVLTASRFDQVLERYENGAPKRMIKHRRGDIVTDLPDVEVERLLRAGAIRPAADVEASSESAGVVLGAGGAGGGTTTLGEMQNANGGAGSAAPENAGAGAGTTDVEMPKKTASTDEWRDYAVNHRDMPREVADSKSRAELIEELA